jgi:2-amino-4-hydroxy-6-hydroxymethyldihydropteridine diphosphokinase
LTPCAVVGLGANLGDRLATMRIALRELRQVARVNATSRVYATAPVGGPAQPDFLNAAALVAHDGSPEDLLDALLAIEAKLGRVRGERWGARLIDLDFLWAEGVVRDGPRLTLPHPMLRTRAFALVPLVEVAPEARDPHTGERYAEIVASLPIAPGALSATADSL